MESTYPILILIEVAMGRWTEVQSALRALKDARNRAME